MGWIRWTGKVLEFSGKIVQASSFEEWAEKQGALLIENVALDSGIKLFKTSRAKSAVWEELAGQFKRSETFLAAIKEGIAAYPGRINAVTSDRSGRLPREGSSDVLVLPSVVVNAFELGFWRSFDSSEELATLKGGPSLREYFFQEMVRQLDSAFSAASERASPKDPIQAGNRWVIGFDPQYAWGDASGHYYVYSSYPGTQGDASKDNRKRAREKADIQLETSKCWLGKLSKERRTELLEKLVS